jgi:hypothetical protein
VIAILLFAALPACSGPPEFIVETEPPAPEPVARSRALSIGSLATPPPGEYRFARIHLDGQVELRELLTVNGPGRWRSYIGRAVVPAAVAQDALATLDTLDPGTRVSAPGTPGEPCVLAFDPPTGDEWQGCADPGLARRVLSRLPRLGPPELRADCRGAVCQIRLLHVQPARRGTGDDGDVQEMVLDDGGALWCADADDASLADDQRQAVTFRVTRAAIPGAGAAKAFGWLTAGIRSGTTDAQAAAAADRVMVRGPQSDWVRLDRQGAETIRARWLRIAERMPASCRLAQ